MLLNSGDSKRVEFKITDIGSIEIIAQDKSIYNSQIEKHSSWWNPFSWSYSGIEWWVWTLIIIGVLGVVDAEVHGN